MDNKQVDINDLPPEDREAIKEEIALIEKQFLKDQKKKDEQEKIDLFNKNMNVNKDKIRHLEISVNKLQKSLKDQERNFELEVSNIKINYLASIMVVIAYILLKENEVYTILGYSMSSTFLIIFISAAIMLFMIKDLITYSKFISRKIIGIK